MLVVAATTPGQSATARSAPLAIRRPAGPALRRRPGRDRHRDRAARTLTRRHRDVDQRPDRFSYQWLRCDGASCQEIAGATGDAYVLTKADKGFDRDRRRDRGQRRGGSATASAAPVGPVAAAPPVNTQRAGDPAGTVIQQGATLTAGGAAWDGTSDTDLQPRVGALRRAACARRSAAPPARSTRCSPPTSATRSWPSAPPPTSTARSPPAPPRPWSATLAGPRWKTLPLISNSAGRVGDTVTVTPGTWSGPGRHRPTSTEMMRCTNVCVPRGTEPHLHDRRQRPRRDPARSRDGVQRRRRDHGVVVALRRPGHLRPGRRRRC